MKKFTKVLYACVIMLLVLGLTACQPDPDEYVVSGAIVDTNGDPVADVVLSMSGDKFSGSTRTDANGNWSAGRLLGEVTIVPEKSGLVFTPSQRVVSGAETGVNFEAEIDTSAFLFLDDFSGQELNPALWNGSAQVSGGQLTMLANNSLHRIWTTQSFTGDVSFHIDIAEFEKVLVGSQVVRNRVSFMLASDYDQTELIRFQLVRAEDRVEVRSHLNPSLGGFPLADIDGPFSITLQVRDGKIDFLAHGVVLETFDNPLAGEAVYLGLQSWTDANQPVRMIYDRVAVQWTSM